MSYRVEYFEVPDPLVLSQDWRAESFDEHLELCKYETTVPAFERWLPRDGRILEAGCGLGRWIAYFAHNGYRLTGLDVTADGMRQLRSKDVNAELVQGDVRGLPFRENSFDAVLSLGVLEHIEEGPEHALEEVVRVLKPGGTLFFQVPYNSPLRRVFVNRLHSLRMFVRKVRGARTCFHEYRFSRREVTRLLTRSGFSIREMVPDDLRPPKNMGMYVDVINLFGSEPLMRGRARSFLYRLFARPDRNCELTGFGNAIARACTAISPFLCCAQVLYVAEMQHDDG